MTKKFIPPEYFLDYLPRATTKVVFLDLIIDEEYTTVAMDLSLYPNPWKALNKNNFIKLLQNEISINESKTSKEEYVPNTFEGVPVKVFQEVTVNVNRISEIESLFAHQEPYEFFIIPLRKYKTIEYRYEHSRS
jgi:hypothetical protein